MNIILIGTQGSGKGAQAERLAKHFCIPTISTGEILREEIYKKTELGRLAASYAGRGNLVPDDLINSIVRKTLLKEEFAGGIIIDGYPRNIVQAESLELFFHPDYVLLLDITDDEAVRRVSGRRVCRGCGATYNIVYKKPKSAGLCDKCGGKLIQREDSTPEVIKTRLAVYHLQTEPLIDFYEKRGVLIKIDGEQSIAKVFQEIVSKLKKHGIRN
ncbi:MAG: nucleoside monophosphate kinase [Patescibacteria group bacterium]|nr:nucleoside monophosphate kinase [Patescibacteria group bacterium]